MVGLLSNKIERDELKPGDHIYSWRHSYLYAHHGIYVGDGNVIHFTRGAGQEIGTGTVLDRIIFSSSPSNPSESPCPRCGDQSKAEGVISSCLECFLSDGELYLFQYGVSPAVFLAKARGGTCSLARSDSPDDVLHRAKYLLQNGFGGYNIFKNNCEDFAVYCKTGLLIFTTVSVGRSGQAASFLAATSAIVSSPLRFMTSGFAGLTAVGCGIYCICRIVSDIGMRRDVMKVPVERLVCHGSIEEAIADVQTPKEEGNEADVQIPKEEGNEADVQIPKEEGNEADVQIPKEEGNEADVQIPKEEGNEADVKIPKEEGNEADVQIPKEEGNEADVKIPKEEGNEADVQIQTPRAKDCGVDVQPPKEEESEAEVELPMENESISETQKLLEVVDRSAYTKGM